MYSVRLVSRNVSVIQIPYSTVLDTRFLLTADRHWDNPASNHEMQIRHLQQAKKSKSGVLDFGDFYCAMQGKFDKRSNKSALRPEHKVDDYLDALVKTGTNFFAPYAEQFIMIAMGNHETAILKHHETNLTNGLVDALNAKKGTHIYNGGYSGWVVFEFIHTKTKKKDVLKLWYIHGYGGGGPVTRGVIQSNRKAVYVQGAQIVVSGHTHDEWVVPISQVGLDEHYRIKHSEQVHVSIPTYKDEYSDGWGGFHVEGGRPPKPIGALWLNFRKEDSNSPLSFDFNRAK
jgi:hypothetical protein